MPERKKWLQASGRAVVGMVVSVVAVASAITIGSIDLPVIARDTVTIDVATQQGAQRVLSCAGPFTELGADVNRPDVALPVGEVKLDVAGEAVETRALSVTEGEGGPAVIVGAAESPLAAAQLQSVKSDSLDGLAASACGEPTNEQWLVGGDTRVGSASTLTLGNPGKVPATVRVLLFDENGPAPAVQTTGVLVPAGAQRTVSINGYGPDRSQIAVRVLSTGAAVTATMGLAQTRDILPTGIDTVMSQTAPAQTLTFVGVTRVSDHDHGAGDAAHFGEDPIFLRLLAPGTVGGSAEVRAIDADGSSTVVGQVTLEPGKVSSTSIEGWEDKDDALVVTSDVPVVGGVLGNNIAESTLDFGWFAPSSELPAGEDIAVAVVENRGATLTLLNNGEAEAEVSITKLPANGLIGTAKATVVRVAAGSTAEVALTSGRALMLSSTEPIRAGVTLLESAGIAAYPVEPPRERSSTMTVYPR